MTQADDAVERATQPRTAPASGGVGVAEPDHDGVRTLFSEYADGFLNTGDRQRVEDHAGGCEQCLADLATLQATVDVLGRLPSRPAPADLKRAIVQRARRAD